MVLKAWLVKKGLGMLSSRKMVQKIAQIALGRFDAFTDVLAQKIADAADDGSTKDQALEAAAVLINEGLDESFRKVLGKLAHGEFEINGGEGDASRKEAILLALDTFKGLSREGLERLDALVDIPLLSDSAEAALADWLADAADLVIEKVKTYAEAYF